MEPPIDPESGRPYWDDRKSVEIMTIGRYVNHYYVPYNTEKRKFYWKPGQYPKNADGTYT
jgi:hypothetical protein